MGSNDLPVVCFGLAEWDSPLPTNQRHLAERLARERPVLFVDTIGTRAPRLAPSDLRRALQRLMRSGSPVSQVDRNLWRLSALGPAPGLRDPMRTWLQRRFVRSLGRALRSLEWSRALAWVFNPRAAFVFEEEGAKLLRNEWGHGELAPLIYHAVDDLTIVPGAAAGEIVQGEAALARRAALLLASAPPILDRLSRMAPGRTRHAPNVADFEHFHRASQAGGKTPGIIDAIPRPRIVFAGNLTESKLDLALTARMAGMRPQWHWVFIGPVWEGLGGSPGLDALRGMPNAHFTGLAPYADLPDWLAGADALFIPYRTDGAAASVFPLKFFEFLATGKPVVSTPLPSLKPHGEFVPLAGDAESFVARLEEALAGAPDSPARMARIELARRNSWDVRMVEIEAWIQEALSQGGKP